MPSIWIIVPHDLYPVLAAWCPQLLAWTDDPLSTTGICSWSVPVLLSDISISVPDMSLTLLRLRLPLCFTWCHES